jgi:Flp pilus assembly pilin Flp
MSDLLRKLSVRLEIAREERGQTASEYVGVLLVVSVVIAAIAGTDVGHEITKRLSDLVENISGGK